MSCRRSTGATSPHVRRFVLDVEIVLVGEVVLAAGTHVAGDRRSASGKHEHDVFAERVQLAPVAGAEALAQVRPAAAASPLPRRCQTWSGTSAACAPTRCATSAEGFRKRSCCGGLLSAKQLGAPFRLRLAGWGLQIPITNLGAPFRLPLAGWGALAVHFHIRRAPPGCSSDSAARPGCTYIGHLNPRSGSAMMSSCKLVFQIAKSCG